MFPFAQWVLNWTTIKPEVIFEIGANYGQDAAGLAKYLNIEDKNVYCFEAVPEICAQIPKFYNFNVYNLAVYNKNGTVEINSVDTKHPKNSGISSILNHKYEKTLLTNKVSVKSVRMDDFMDKNNIKEIDFLKLDVEGCTYEVLEGFGERLKDVKVIHLEAEHTPVWEGQKLFCDIEKYIQSFGFELVYFNRYWLQSDSVWVQKQYLKN